MLREDAMIVRLKVRQWSARKYDKKVTHKVADEFGAGDDAGRYNKVLISKDLMKKLTTAVSNIRNYHYEATLPWDDSGARILPAAMFMDYSKKMRELRTNFESAVSDFVDNYDDYREEARIRLNGMFNEDDYPSRFEVESKCSVETNIEPVPSSDDFRVNIQSKDQDRLKAELDNRVDSLVKSAMADLYDRLFSVVNSMVERLSGDGIFRDSLVGNIEDLVSIIPKLNLTNDPKIEEFRKEVLKKLTVKSPAELRSDPKVKIAVASDAQAILDKMSGYLKR